MTLASSSETDNLLELYQQDVDSKTVTVPETMRSKKMEESEKGHSSIECN